MIFTRFAEDPCSSAAPPPPSLDRPHGELQVPENPCLSRFTVWKLLYTFPLLMVQLVQVTYIYPVIISRMVRIQLQVPGLVPVKSSIRQPQDAPTKTLFFTTHLTIPHHPPPFCPAHLRICPSALAAPLSVACHLRMCASAR